MQLFRVCVLILVGVIHLLPVIGVLGANTLEKLYGIKIGEENTLLLMRHRAVLFGILSVVMFYSAFKPDLHGFGLLMAILSIVSFLLLVLLSDNVNHTVTRLFIIDLFALVLLASAFLTLFYRKSV